MKELFKNKLFISFEIIIVITIILSIVLIIFKKSDNEKIGEGEGSKIEEVELSEVEVIYNSLTNVDCNKELIWKFEDDVIKANEIDNNIKIKMVLARLNTDNKLNEELSEKVFKEYSSLVFGKAVEVILEDTIFLGKKYSIGSSTTISDVEACKESKYKSMLFGYTYSGEVLSVDVAVGIVEDDSVYDLDNNKLGKYTTDDEMNELLRNSLIIRYGFKKENSNYYLDNITKVVTVKLED